MVSGDLHARRFLIRLEVGTTALLYVTAIPGLLAAIGCKQDLKLKTTVTDVSDVSSDALLTGDRKAGRAWSDVIVSYSELTCMIPDWEGSVDRPLRSLTREDI